jgi:hypothetical protein
MTIKVVRRTGRRVRARVELEALALIYTLGLIELALSRSGQMAWRDGWLACRADVVRLVDRRMA